MSIQLGDSGSIPVGLDNSISIPSSNAPQNELKKDAKLQILSTPNGTNVDTYKVMASSGDSTPGYLSDKIDTQFGIVSQKLRLTGFGTLTTDYLNEGATNKYLTATNFNNLFALRTTTNLTEGTNWYYTTTRFNATLATKTTDNLVEGLTNKYMSSAVVADVVLNTAARHSHSNKSLLDTITSNNLLSSAVAPLDLTLGVLTHLNNDGQRHVPATSTANNNKILKAGASAGIFTWETFDSVAATSGIFETSPSTSVVKTLTSNYIKTHVENSLAEKHVTAANLTYINTTIPAHISSVLLHIPAFTPVTDRLKFLYINSSDTLAWSSSSTAVTIAGTGGYLTALGATVTANPIGFSNTLITAGSNITIDSGLNTISATQRACDDIPSDGSTTTSISSNWAFDHNAGTGNGKHVPALGTTNHFLAWDGTFKSLTSYISGGVYKVTLGPGGTNGSITTRLNDTTNKVLPSGWTAAIDAVTTDLNITHNVNKAACDVTVWSDDLTNKTKLIGSAAYSTIVNNLGNTVIKIASLATVNYKIHIYIQFE